MNRPMTTRATIRVELEPFSVPNSVRAVKKAGQEPTETACYPLSDLDSGTLDHMCNRFRDAVFAKAGKEQPPTAACGCGR